LFAGSFSTVAVAEEPEQAYRTASEQIANAAQEASTIEQAVKSSQRARGPQQRIADAVLLMGVKDYDRAADVLNGVVEEYETHPTAYADGLNLLAETYFLSKQYLSAQRVFTKFIQQGDARFKPYRERSVIRLVDIALRLRDFKALDDLFTQVGSLGSEASSGLAYAKGKGMLAQGKLDAADAALRGVAADSQFNHQTRYLLGVVAMLKATPPDAKDKDKKEERVPKGRYDQAIERFKEVTQLPGDTAEHRQVIDLAWLAIGRLMYETNQFSQAVDAYNRIDRTSPEFGSMLYELAWVYVKMGDYIRAQRALEVLAVAAPNSQDVADGSLLRADLMLRAGQFEKSLRVYESVRGTYETMRDRVDQFLGSTSDPGVYFDTLSSDQLELFESGQALPTMVLKWAREGEDGATAFAVIDDVSLCRRLIKESNEMIERLNAVLSSPNKIRAIPGLKSGAERGLGLLNAVGLARLKLAHGLDGVDADLSPELRQVRAQRKALEERLGQVPVSSADFTARETQAKRQWNKASQELKRIELEVDTLQATINGLERVLTDGPGQGIVRSPQQLQMYRHALDEQKRLVSQYRSEAAELRRITDAAKIQVGFGDKRFLEDEQVRKQFAQVLWQEVRLSGQGAGGGDLAAFANRVAPLLSKADQTDQQVESALQKLYAAVNEKVAELRSVVQKETQNIVDYSLRLETLDKEARLVVGGVAMRNFATVRDRLKNIVLRADVGITEEAWEVREEQQTRVRRLKVEKARTEARLQEELDEVLDDSGDGDAEERKDAP
jgi:tetratricopeptide (TPR) repeat protein